MDAKREADELASRCLALVVFYQHARKAHPKWPGMKAETRAVAAQAKAGGIAPEVIAARVASELQARYEPAMAGRLHREFLAGFTGELAIDLVLA
jgi:hypothetical protein